MLNRSSRGLLCLGCFVSLFLGSSEWLAAQGSDAEALRHFHAAQQAQNAGSLDVAAREYLEVIHLRPEAAEAYASLGLVYNAEGKLADSAQALRKAEKLKPGLPGVSLYLGIDYVELLTPALAVPRLVEAVRLEPNNKQAHTWLSRALWDDGQTEAALEQLRQSSVLFPADVALLLDLGQAYRKAADQGIRNVLASARGKPLLHQVYGDIYSDERAWEKATAHYHLALNQDPHWMGGHFGLGEIALRKGKLDDATHEYREELQINPSSAAALARLGEIALLQGKPTDALTLFDAAIHAGPEQASNALGLPRTYPSTTEGLSKDAQEQIRGCLPALESAPSSSARSLALALVNARLGGGQDAGLASAWNDFQSTAFHATSPSLYDRGLRNYDRQDFHAAEVDLNKWLNLHPHDLQASYLLAKAYRNLSLSTLENLLALAPDSYPAHELLAVTYQDADKNDQALEEYRTVAKIAPNLPGVHFSIGHLLLKMGRPNEAAEELAAELLLNPNHTDANADMGTILVAQQEPEKAIPYLERAVRGDPNLWASYRLLGKAYYQQKAFAKAEAALQHAIRDDPEGLAHYQLGLVYRDMGQKETARAEFELSRKLKLDSLSHAETQMTTLEAIP